MKLLENGRLIYFSHWKIVSCIIFLLIKWSITSPKINGTIYFAVYFYCMFWQCLLFCSCFVYATLHRHTYICMRDHVYILVYCTASSTYCILLNGTLVFFCMINWLPLINLLNVYMTLSIPFLYQPYFTYTFLYVYSI